MKKWGGSLLVAASRFRLGPDERRGLAAVARTEPRRTRRRIRAAEGVARPTDRALEGRRRFGYATPLARRQSPLHVLAAGRERSDGGARRRFRQGALADELSGAVQDGQGGGAARTRTEVDAGVRRRQAVFDRHERHRHRVRCRDRQAALAEAGPAGAAALDVTLLLAARRSRPRRRSTWAATIKGTLSAFDVNTGEVKWAWSGDGPGYGSPMLFDFGGTRADRDHDPAEVHRAGSGHRQAAVGAALHHRVRAEHHHAGPLRRHAHRLRVPASRWWHSGSRARRTSGARSRSGRMPTSRCT